MRKIQRNHRPRQDKTQALEKPRHREYPRAEGLEVKHQASKGRLLGIFSRTRSTKASTTAVGPKSEWNGPADQEQETPLTATRIPPAQQTEDSVVAISTPAIEAVKQQPSKAKRSKSFRNESSTTKSIPWDPPPLFQAYPQSVKHGRFYAPDLSADTILRCRNEKQRKHKKDTLSSATRANGVGNEDKSQKDDQDSPQQLELSQKIYILVTSGYFLQYSGEGSFDRLPEKIMPIGQDSAAFASDAIPGRHWVLQVSHASDENGNPKLEKWSFARRLGIRGDMKRCIASNFLLILNSPGDLDSWLIIVRKEIEAWGGKRYQSDSAVHPSANEMARTLQERPSRRYLVKRDPNQFSNVARDSNAACDGAVLAGTPGITTRKHSSATQDSVRSPSTSNMTTSTDQNLLDRLKNSPRMSYISTGAKTYSTSQESSPVPSPTSLAFHLEGFTSSHEQLETADRPAIIAGQSSRSLSVIRSPPLAAFSNGAPNFSVPSFSKRYSGAYNTPPLSTTSSNTSNPPRKLASSPTIDEQHDHFQDTGTISEEDERRQESRYVAARTTDGIDRNLLSGDRRKLAAPSSALKAPSSDQAVPRRFSSLEYSRGISPINDHSPHNSSPHRQPTSALPALSKSSSNILSAPTRNLRRPISMQIHSSALPSPSTDLQSSLPTIPSPSANSLDPPPPPPFMPFSSSVHSQEQHLLPPSKVLNRRSMPHLSQPPSDPPNRPLPTPPVPRLPPIKLSSGSLRRSVEKPLRAGLGRRDIRLLEGDGD
ncbi:MAG: hypothetical protein Q9225_000326 [Loekoesia sp. 1 TL-2023]